MKWLVTCDFKDENYEESETLCPLPRFKRVQKVMFKNWCWFCSYHHRQRYGIDYAHTFHVLSQAKEFEEPNHHNIIVQWWNIYYRVACLLSNNKQFDALEKVVKMLMQNEKERLPVKLEWFNHLPIFNEWDLPIELKECPMLR